MLASNTDFYKNSKGCYGGIVGLTGFIGIILFIINSILFIFALFIKVINIYVVTFDVPDTLFTSIAGFLYIYSIKR